MILVEQTDSQGLPQLANGSDEELIKEILSGKVPLFAVLVRRYNPRLFRIARSILGDDDEAEDAVQLSFVAAYRHLSSFRGDASFGTWLSRITVREALRRRGQQQRDRRIKEQLPERVSAPHEVDPEQAIQWSRVRKLIEDLVDNMPDEYRTVFVMRDVQQLSTRETAEALELSEEAVRVRLHRARARLRLHLKATMDLPPTELFEFGGDRCDAIVSRVWAAVGSTGDISVLWPPGES